MLEFTLYKTYDFAYQEDWGGCNSQDEPVDWMKWSDTKHFATKFDNHYLSQ